MKRLVLIDGNAIIHRAFHALPDSLTTSSGIPVNAVFGFTSMLFKVLTDLHPEYVACTFDLKAPTFRHKEFKEYKATRPKMKEELVGQIPLVHQVVETMNIPIFEKEGYEADDVIGTLAFQARSLKIKNQKSRPEADRPLDEKLKTETNNLKPGSCHSEGAKRLKNLVANSEKVKDPSAAPQDDNNLEIIIVTGDRDTLQLVNETTKVYCPLKGLSNPVLYDENLVKQKYGLTPCQLIDYKTLMGDPSDNIPGIAGIGPKTASSLLQKYGTIEGIYKHLNEIESQSVRDRLKAGEKDLKLSKRLVTIFLEVPITLDLEKCRLMDYDRNRVVDLFRQLEFNTLIPRLPMDIHEFKIKDPLQGKQRSKIKDRDQKPKNDKDNNQLGLF